MMSFLLSRRAFRVMCVATLTGALLTACGKSGTAAQTSPTRGTVTFWARHSAQDKLLLKGFSKAYPDIHVQLEPEPASGGAAEKLATAIRGGAQPSLVDLNDIYSPIFAKAGDLVNLTSFYKSLPYHSSLNKGQLSLGQYDGNVYALPFIADLSMEFYNKTLLAKAGITTVPTTLAGIEQDAKIVVQKVPGSYGFTAPLDSPGCMGFIAIPSLGASKTGNTPLFRGSLTHQAANLEGNQGLIKLLNFYRAMWVDRLEPAYNRTSTCSTFGVHFLQGHIAITFQDFGMASRLRADHVKWSWGIAPIPTVSGGGSTFDGGDTLVIPKKNGSNPAAAETVIRWLLSRKSQLTFPSQGDTPVRTDLLTPSYKKAHPSDAVALAALEHGVVPDTLAYAALFNVPSAPFGSMLYSAVLDKSASAVTSAIHQAQSQFTSILKTGAGL